MLYFKFLFLNLRLSENILIMRYFSGSNNNFCSLFYDETSETSLLISYCLLTCLDFVWIGFDTAVSWLLCNGII